MSKQHPRNNSSSLSPFSFYSPKLSVYLLITCAFLFILFQIQSLQTPTISPPSSSSSFEPELHSSWTFMSKWNKYTIINSDPPPPPPSSCSDQDHQDDDHGDLKAKLRDSVTFLPLKDLRFSRTAQQGHTWFMSSMYDTHEEGEVQYQKFPSKSSKGRILCLKGRDTHEGAWNSYALAWPEALPQNATLMKGLTFVSYNHYNYDNIWHGLSAMVPFVAWHIKNKCTTPNRWILYHWGELRSKMGPWLKILMEATFGEPLHIEVFDNVRRSVQGNETVVVDDDSDDDDENTSYCFEDAVVMRHNEGGMSRQRRMEVYDLLRCKARIYCNVSLKGRISDVTENGLPVIGMTLFMRTGARSFKNESAVVDIFGKECGKVDGCRFTVAYSNNLTFCEQVIISIFFFTL